MDILKPRDKPGFALPEAISLTGFCLLLLWCIPHHESWFDEAQAWLIARDSSLRDLLVYRLHYEGAPALWHLLLWIEIRLHVSFLGMHYITGVIASVGIYIWLRFNPLPRIISLLVPFTFFLQYQYAIVARSYCLFPLLAFALFALYQNKKSRPVSFCIVAGLLANCSLHMAAFAAGVILLYALDRWQMLQQNHRSIDRRQVTIATIILLFSFTLSAAVARPTADGSFGNPVINKIRKVLSGSSHASADIPLANIGFDVPPHQGRVAGAIWHAIHPPLGSSHKAVVEGKLIKRALVIPTALTAPISTSNLLALVFLVLLVLNLSRQRLWLSLAPYALVFFLFITIRGESHYLGILWIALLCSIWTLSLKSDSSRSVYFSLRSALYAVTLVVVLLQIGWSAHSLYADVYGPYSGDEATAAFLRQQPADKRIAAFDIGSTAVNAYLQKSRYFNQRVAYWPFSKTSDPSLTMYQVMEQRPDMVVGFINFSHDPFINQWLTITTPGTLDYDPATFRLLAKDGYRETHRFCGQHLYRDTSEYTACRVIFEREAVDQRFRQ